VLSQAELSGGEQEELEPSIQVATKLKKREPSMRLMIRERRACQQRAEPVGSAPLVRPGEMPVAIQNA